MSMQKRNEIWCSPKMDGKLSAGAVEKITNGEVKSEADMILIFEVYDVKITGNFLSLTLFDGTKSIKAVTCYDPGEIHSNSFVRLNQFTCVYQGNQCVIMVNSLDVLQNNENWTSSTEVVWSSQEEVVYSTPECESLEAVKSSALEHIHLFSKKLHKAEVFVHKTTKKKDEIRAMIRCVCLLEDRFQLLGGGQGLYKEENTQMMEGHDKDRLRSNASMLLKLFKTGTFEKYVKTSTGIINRASVKEKAAVNDIDSFLQKYLAVLHAVMYKGFDCRQEYENEEESDDHSM